MDAVPTVALKMVRGAAADEALLAEFARTGAEACFRAIVDRHGAWVYGAAFRQLRDRQAAEDAAQAVFILLCQRAGKLTGRQKIAGWLFVTLQYTVRGMLRAHRRRQFHEKQAIAQRTQSTEVTVALENDLDAAVARLGAADRMAIVLRFYEGLDFAIVAQRLGINERAARKRVTRAVARLRGTLGPVVSPEMVASAAAVGAPLAPGAINAKLAGTALAAAGGKVALTGGAAAALKGATVLMAMTKVKVIAVAAGAMVLALLAGVAVEKMWPAENKPAATQQAAREPETAPVAPAEPAPQTFEELYALKEGQAIRRVMPPFMPERLEFYRTTDPTQAQAIPRGPDGMLITWKNGKPSAWGMTFGGGGYQFQQLIEYYLKVFGPEIEGDAPLRKMVLPGDFVIRETATPEEYRVALEKIISEASGATVKLTFRDVERPVYVLKGKWQYARLEALKDQPQRGEQIEIYGRDLNTDMRTGGGGAGTTADLAGWISRWIDKQAVIDATDAPPQIHWHINSNGDGARESQQKSKDPELVIKHLEDQTGLTASLETRKVRRLFVETGK